MNSVADTRGTPAHAQEQAPRARYGGAVTLRGQEYATTAELERALAGAVEDAGATRWRLTRRGWEAVAQPRRARGAATTAPQRGAGTMPRTKKKRTGEPGGAETVARMLKRVDEGVWEVPGAGGGRLVKGRFLTLEDAKLAMLAYSLELEATRRRPEPFADELVALVGPGLDGADADAE